MGNKILIRPDGSELRVPDTEASKLLTLGYREKTPTEILESGISEGTAEHYSTPGQRVLTAVEGGLSGLSVGLTDLALTESGKERARYNPGLRLGSEVAGGLLPLVPGLGVLKNATPAGLLARGAERAGEAVGKGSRTIAGLTRGAVEGGGLGAGAAISNAQISGDPLTAESIMAGVGWGAVFGGGLGALGGAIEGRYEAKAARKLAERESELAGIGLTEQAALQRADANARSRAVVSEGVKSRHAALGALEDGQYTRFAGALDDAVTELKIAKKEALDLSELKGLNQELQGNLVDQGQTALRKPMRQLQKNLAAAIEASGKGEHARMVKALEAYAEGVDDIQHRLGGEASIVRTTRVGKSMNVTEVPYSKVAEKAQELAGLGRLRVEEAAAAAEDLTSMEAVRTTLKGLPKTAEEFTRLSPQRVERLTAAVEKLGKVKSAELAGVQESVSLAIDDLASGLGLKMEGSPGMKLQGLWKGLKDSRGKRAADELRAAQEGNLLWRKVDSAQDKYEKTKFTADLERKDAPRRSGGWGTAGSLARYGAGTWAASKLGPGGYVLGAGLVTGLMNLKGAILGTIAEKANVWLPRAGRAMQKAGPRVEPLARRVDGSEDQGEKDRRELMKARAKEIHEAAPNVRDTLYRSIEPLAMKHPELAASIHAHGVSRFQFILSKLPKDPGLAFSNLKSLWKPDAVAIEKFARYYEVFQNPVEVMSKALSTGKITMEAAEGLREMNPELFQVLRVHMLERLSDPKIQKKMTYQDQVHLGVLLDLPLHSTMHPSFISAQQQMYTERNKPLEMSPRIQPGGGAGRPSGPGPSATSAQRTTEH